MDQIGELYIALMRCMLAGVMLLVLTPEKAVEIVVLYEVGREPRRQLEKVTENMER